MSSSKATPSFGDFYTLADYTAYRVHAESAPRNAAGKKLYSGAEYEQHRNGVKPYLNTAEQACAAFLGAMLERGVVSCADFIEGRGLPTGEALRRLVAADPEEAWLRPHDIDLLKYRMLSVWLSKAMRLESMEVNEGYQAIVGYIDRGDFPYFELMGDREICDRTGARLLCQMTGWKLQYGVPPPRDTPRYWEQSLVLLAADAPRPSVQHVTIPTPSGRLLLADWFRIPQFTQALKREDKNFEINTSSGCVQQTQHYAQAHGLASVFVGNSSPDVVVRDGRILIGGAADVDEGLKDAVGNICTDLWWATAIDASVLKQIVADELVREGVETAAAGSQADALVEGYVKQHGVVTVPVPQGELHLYFSDATDRLMKFEGEGVASEDFEPLDLVLSPSEVAWANRQKHEDAPAPQRMR